MGLSFAAPLAGRDAISSAITGVYTPFQSTHPSRGATTGRFCNKCSRVAISIHAPLAGCDVFLPSGCSRFYHFNPRPPCGVRHSRRMDRHCKSEFQSTHPLRGATTYTGTFSGPASNFNPRTPCGVRLADDVQHHLRDAISIHAPLAGCDPERQTVRHDGRISIHAPLAGCDGGFRLDDADRLFISIHAPLAGCDGSRRCS